MEEGILDRGPKGGEKEELGTCVLKGLEYSRHKTTRSRELVEAFERLKLVRLEWMPRSPPHDQKSTTSR